MSKFSYKAIGPGGEIATRKSDRTYTHAVFTRSSKERAIYWANQRAPHHDSNFWYHMDYINGTSEWLNKRNYETVEQWEARIEQAKARAREALAGCSSPDEWFAYHRTKALAKIEAKDWSVWGCVAWCGRYDLAVKQKMHRASRDGIDGCEIVEVSIGK